MRSKIRQFAFLIILSPIVLSSAARAQQSIEAQNLEMEANRLLAEMSNLQRERAMLDDWGSRLAENAKRLNQLKNWIESNKERYHSGGSRSRELFNLINRKVDEYNRSLQAIKPQISSYQRAQADYRSHDAAYHSRREAYEARREAYEAARISKKRLPPPVESRIKPVEVQPSRPQAGYYMDENNKGFHPIQIPPRKSSDVLDSWMVGN